MYIIIATIIDRACTGFNTDILEKAQTPEEANEKLRKFNFMLRNKSGYEITNSNYWNTVAFNKTNQRTMFITIKPLL